MSPVFVYKVNILNNSKIHFEKDLTIYSLSVKGTRLEFTVTT